MEIQAASVTLKLELFWLYLEFIEFFACKTVKQLQIAKHPVYM